jgi:hypothetical protein
MAMSSVVRRLWNGALFLWLAVGCSPITTVPNRQAEREQAVEAAERVIRDTRASALQACQAGDIAQAVALLLSQRSALVHKYQRTGVLSGTVSPALERAIAYHHVYDVMQDGAGECKEYAPEIAGLAFRYYQTAEGEPSVPLYQAFIYRNMSSLGMRIGLPAESTELLWMRANHYGALASSMPSAGF